MIIYFSLFALFCQIMKCIITQISIFFQRFLSQGTGGSVLGSEAHLEASEASGHYRLWGAGVSSGNSLCGRGSSNKGSHCVVHCVLDGSKIQQEVLGKLNIEDTSYFKMKLVNLNIAFKMNTVVFP